MKKLLVLLIICLLTNINTLLAQEESFFEFDYSRFFYDSSNVYLEFYYSFNQKGLKIIEENEGFKVQALLHIELYDTVKNEYFMNKDYKVENILTDTSKGALDNNLMGVLGVVIPEGTYELAVVGKDMNDSMNTKEIKETVVSNPDLYDKLSVSDVQLASRIVYDGANPNSIFYKNTLEVFPNPSMVYYYTSPVMFYYAELYNLLPDSNSQSFILQKVLYNNNGTAVYQKSKNLVPKKNSVADFGLVNLSKFPTDVYSFVLTIIDSTKQVYSNSYKKFYFYNPNVEAYTYAGSTDKGVLESEFSLFTMDECDYMFNAAKYIAADKEVEQYEKLDSLQVKRKFLFDFWNRRDPEPSTLKNEFKEEYMQRVEYVNKNFGNKFKEGYKSERGRIYLVYGEPDQMDRFPNESFLKPYEVWSYNSIEGGVQFIFGDLTGFSNYELLHSTKRGEYRDDNWQYRLQVQR